MRVLLVDDDPDQLRQLRQVIIGWRHQVDTARDGAEALEVLSSFTPNVMVTDLKMPRMDGFELMRHLKAEGALPPTIVLTAFGSIELALETVHDHGGFWFLEKPVDVSCLHALLQRASDHGRLASDNERLRQELAQTGALENLAGQSPEMLHIFALIRQVAPTTAGVLLTGESGSGKELVARAIHSLSHRGAEPFVAINCAALPETLMETELFGHEKGAFTGALERRIGALELAQGGTLFLDEVADMPLPMQAKMLRVLEDFQFRRVGGKTEMFADVRVIAATNRAPISAMHEGKLREDLFYRLNVFHIHLPPLRDRIQDIPAIASALIENLNRKHGTHVAHLDPAALDALKAHRWTGNVRELRNTLERAVILAGEGLLLREHLDLPAHHLSAASAAVHGVGIEVGMSIDEAERVLIGATLRQTRNNKTRAATILGISAKTLHVKLKQYRLDDADDVSDQTGMAAS